MTTALLIIDVQHALCVGDEAAFDIERIVSRINELSAKARAAGHPVVLVQHEEAEGPLQFGADGWQLVAGLTTSPQDLRVRKKSPSSFQDTELQSLLQARGVTRLVICGLQTDCCVNATVRAALEHGYEVVLAGDAHSTVSNPQRTADQIIAEHNTALAGLNVAGRRIAVVPADAALAA